MSGFFVEEGDRRQLLWIQRIAALDCVSLAMTKWGIGFSLLLWIQHIAVLQCVQITIGMLAMTLNCAQSLGGFFQCGVVFCKAKPEQFEVFAIGIKGGNGNGGHAMLHDQSLAEVFVVFI